MRTVTYFLRYAAWQKESRRRQSEHAGKMAASGKRTAEGKNPNARPGPSESWLLQRTGSF